MELRQGEIDGILLQRIKVVRQVFKEELHLDSVQPRTELGRLLRPDVGHSQLQWDFRLKLPLLELADLVLLRHQIVLIDGINLLKLKLNHSCFKDKILKSHQMKLNLKSAYGKETLKKEIDLWLMLN